METFTDALRLRHEGRKGGLGRVDMCGSNGFVLVQTPHV